MIKRSSLPLFYLATAIPSVPYLLLNYFMPSQFLYVPESGLAQTWPFLIAVLLTFMFVAGCTIIAADRNFLSVRLGILIVLPLLLTLMAYIRAVPTISSVTTAIVILAMWVMLFRYLRNSTILSVRFVVGFSIAFFLSAGIAHLWSPIEFSRFVGSYGILSMFIGICSILLLAAALRPRVGGALALSLIVLGLFNSRDHRIKQVSSERTATFFKDNLEKWVANRKDLNAYKAAKLPYPVILVSSEGGGIYAAAHAFQTLSQLASHCPTFTQHVLALVGVSGGSFGNALFTSNIEPVQHDYEACKPESNAVDTGALSADHLAPTLARFLWLETIDAIVPGQWLESDRASILVESMNSSAHDPKYLSGAVGSSWDPAGVRPALVAVATNMENGRRFVISPLVPQWSENTVEWWPDQATSDKDMTLMEAAGISARFPWITPTARVDLSDKEFRILADGGYFENSGAETVLDFVSEIKTIDANQSAREEAEKLNIKNENETDTEAYQNFGEEFEKLNEEIEVEADSDCRVYVASEFRKKVSWDGCSIHIYLIHLAIAGTSIDDDSEVQNRPASRSSFVFDPISTLLSTRTARGRLALERASSQLCGTRGGECVMNPKPAFAG